MTTAGRSMPSKAHSFVFRNGDCVCSACGVVRVVSEKMGVQFFKPRGGELRLVGEPPPCKTEHASVRTRKA